MSYRDEMETLTGVPMGHTAFTSVPPKAPEKLPDPKKKKKYMSKAEQAISVLDSDEERAAKRKAASEARRSGFASAKEVAIAARGAVMSAHVAKARKENPRHGTLYGISRVSDERITAHKARENAIIAKKNVSTFNVQIPNADESRRTQSIGGKL